MENIKIANHCGLCAGCTRAINLAIDATNQTKVTLFKEIVHNNNVNQKLKSMGINQIENIFDASTDSTIIIRAHGEPPETYNYLNERNIKFIDGTCLNVTKIHNEVEKYSKQDYIIAIVGKYGKKSNIIHPEVAGTIGYCKNPILIEDIDDIEKIKNIYNSKIFVVCQTTFNPETFDIISNNLLNLAKTNNNEIIIKNTICGAQKMIQKSTLELARNSDLMIIVGGKNSSNTIELFENTKKICNAIHIENINDWQIELEKNNFIITPSTRIGLSAGASTDKDELILLKTILTNYLSTI